MNLQLTQNRSTLQPKKGHQRDPYVGQYHNQTKLRHGKGIYQYKNKYFEYDGNYVQGQKNGPGTLKMSNGTKIQANFTNDEITGEGKITYPDGSYYEGGLQNGQRNGIGKYQSMFEKYDGEWKQNMKDGKGRLEIISTGQVFEGTFKNNKLQGVGILQSYNYLYSGQWVNGQKQGNGQQTSQWKRLEQESNNEQTVSKAQTSFNKAKNYDSHFYKGEFLANQFNGQGMYVSKSSNYELQGQFISGLPKDYPNQFRILVSSSTRSQQNGQITQNADKTALDTANPVIQYELESDPRNLYVQCVYQGPEYMDQNQPTEEEIDVLIKNWQNQNKKNKNPPPMPDFRAPKTKKPQLLLINQEKGRPIQITLQKQTGEKMKVDYRIQIAQKRQQIEKLKQQQKKVEEQDPKKKGGKKQNKGETQYKINLFKQVSKRKQQRINLQTMQGSCCISNFQLPDDFPIGKYSLVIDSPFQDFGKLQPKRVQLIVKSKQQAGKKK